MVVVGVEIAPNLVAQVIREDSWFSEVEACLPDSGGGFSPGVACRERRRARCVERLGLRSSAL